MLKLLGRKIFVWNGEDAMAAVARAIQTPEQGRPCQFSCYGVTAPGPNQGPGLHGFRAYASQEVVERPKRSISLTCFDQPVDDGACERLDLYESDANRPGASRIGPIAGVDIRRQDLQAHPPCF